MRLPYTENSPTVSEPHFQDFISKLLRSRGARGLSPFDRALLHSPPLARGFLQFFTAVRGNSTLPDDVKELAICRVGALNRAAFEWMHHAPLLREAGVSEEGLDTVRTWETGKLGKDGKGGLSERLWAVMLYADAMTKEVQVSDETFNRVKEHFNDRQMVELSMSSLILSFS